MKNILSSYKSWLPWLLVIIAIPVAYEIYTDQHASSSNKQKRKFNNRATKLRVVKVEPFQKADVNPSWHTSGTVMASEVVTISAQVTGQISEINPKAQPGALFEKGEWLVKLDDTNLALNLSNQKAQLIQAQSNLDLELADQQLAKEELSLIGDEAASGIELALVLREPQFKSAQARVDIAKVNVKRAEIELERTEVKMPFDGQIISRNTGRGSRVGQNTNLFEVINVDEFWLEVKIPRTFYELLDQRQIAKLTHKQFWQEGQFRTGKIVAILPELDSRDRQVKLLLSVKDPLNIKQYATNYKQKSQNKPKVFINDFINVELKGRALKNVWTIKSHWLQSDNTIWVVDNEKRLQKRKVKILFKGRELIYVKGDIQKGDMALNEKPGIATIGMKVRARKVDVDIKQAKLSQKTQKQQGEEKRKKLTDKQKKERKEKREKKQAPERQKQNKSQGS